MATAVQDNNKYMENLKHEVEDFENGGFVLVLDTGSTIDPQSEAMLQALHSRSTGGIKKHLQVLQEKGSENFMERFYVGYGHKSIGDCANTTVFVEGISMLAAKAIQDWRLYSGQEASTRYVDFSKQVFLDPLHSEQTTQIMEDWREFYLKIQLPLQQDLKRKYPIATGENEKTYHKAIVARAFDISRAFLPAGATTNVAWRMNFRQFADELFLLRHHPLQEVRTIAEKTEIALQKMYPQSFGHKRYEKTEMYNKMAMENYYYINKNTEEFALTFNGLNNKILNQYTKLLKNRPPKTELPPYVCDAGILTYEFLLDFGSFRDIQRHRAVIQRMPLITMKNGFENWYLENLPDNIRQEAEQLIVRQKEKINNMETDDTIKQYYMPMGYRVPCRVTGDLKALVYLAELRCTRFVHPTLVRQMLRLIESLKALTAEYGLVIYQDDEPDRFDIKRGEHDIVSTT